MINYDEKEFLWCEKYRPKTIAEMILPQRMKESFQAIIDSGELQNSIFSGSAGCGKCLSGEELITIEMDETTFNQYFANIL